MATAQPTWLVFVDGELVGDSLTEAHTSHGIEQPVGQATVVLTLPRPAAVVFNKVVEIYAFIQSDELFLTETARIFQGVVRNDRDTMDENGLVATLNCEGWAYILSMPSIADTVWDGPISARAVIVGVLATYGFGEPGGPQYEVKNLVNNGGDLVMLGGNADVDAGQVRWEQGESGLSFIQRICSLYGYFAYDCPDGIFRVTRAVGAPTGTAVMVWEEAEDILSAGRTRSSDEVANWIEVTGATPLPDDGTRPDPYSSAPSSPDLNELIPEPGVKFKGISDDLLVSDEMCDDVRTIAELRYNTETPPAMYDLTDWGYPKLRPGRKVTLVADTLDISQSMWLWTIAQDLTDAGYWATYTMRRDLGDTPDDGDEICTTTELIAAASPRHFGDETLAYYAVPVPEGTSGFVNFTPTDDLGSLKLFYEAHGTNSWSADGGTAPATASRFRLEQPVGTVISTTVMPVLPERGGLSPAWVDIELPISGKLADGVGARLYILSSSDGDDFEIRDLQLYACFTGTPDTPGDPFNPPIPAPKPTPTPSVCWFSPPDVTVPPKVNYGSMTIPAGTVWVWFHGDAEDATGDPNGLFPEVAGQGYAISGAGLRRWLLEEGTATESDPDAAYRNLSDVTGVVLVGDGPFDCFYRCSATGLSADVTTSWNLHGGTSLTVSNVCVRFLALGDWPY